MPPPPLPPPLFDGLGGLQPYDVAQDCTPDDSFAHIEFRNAELVRSNLGGQGGRCASLADCTETCSNCADETCTAAECVGMPEEIYIKGVGVNGKCALSAHLSFALVLHASSPVTATHLFAS